MTNIIYDLIEARMQADNWTCWSPDSIASYLQLIDDDEILEALKEKYPEQFPGPAFC